MASNDDRDRVLAATDLLSIVGEVVALRPKGREHVGLCPFHDDRSPSMAVVTHKGGYGADAFYKCFACGAGGNAFDFVMNYHKLEFREALKYLADRAGIELTPWEGARTARRDGEPTRDEILRANELAHRFFRRTFADEARGAKARTEVARRGFEAEITEGFGIGAAPAATDALVAGVRQNIASGVANFPPFEAFVQAGVVRPARGGHVDLLRDRLVFPIRDDMGRAIAFGGRKLDPEQEPKYLNSPESPVFHKSKSLYGIDRAKRAIIETKTAIITEGYTDVIACHRGGFTNAVATLGTALTREHAKVLRRMSDNVVLLFDGDEAGLKAADRALEVFFAEPVDIKVCVLPDGLDPDDLLRQDGGRERFRAALERSTDLLTFMTARIRAKFAGRGLSARQQTIETTLAKFVDLGVNTMSGLRRHLVLQALSDLFDMPARELDALCQAMKPRASAMDTREAGSDDAVITNASVVEVPLSPGSAARRRARLGAERRLLGILCTDPGLASVQVSVQGCGMLPLSEAIAPTEFADQGHSAIFAAIRDAAEEGRAIRFATLLGELADAALKRLASDLYTFGEDLLQAAQSQAAMAGSRRTPAEEVVVSWNDLENLERRSRLRSSSELSNSEGSGEDRDVPSRVSTEGSTPSAGSDERSASQRSATEQAAIDRLARARERGHDATAVSALFSRRSTTAGEGGLVPGRAGFGQSVSGHSGPGQSTDQPTGRSSHK
jgi:DNA primase